MKNNEVCWIVLDREAGWDSLIGVYSSRQELFEAFGVSSFEDFEEHDENGMLKHIPMTIYLWDFKNKQRLETLTTG